MHEPARVLIPPPNSAAGYPHPVDEVVSNLVSCMDSPRLALTQWADEYAVVRSRLPSTLCQVGLVLSL